jgi:hypothetical protein
MMNFARNLATFLADAVLIRSAIIAGAILAIPAYYLHVGGLI